MRYSDWLPEEVSDIYNETHAALSNGLNTLAGVGIRMMIEAVCREKNATGGNLKERIDALVVSGVLTSVDAETLHLLREIGNESAHEITAPSEVTLGTMMDIAENLLRSVYILPIVGIFLLRVDKHAKST